MPILDTEVSSKSVCQQLCRSANCSFFVFDDTMSGFMCRVYNESFATFIEDCHVIGGPKVADPGCDYDQPPDNSCQVVREASCQYDSTTEWLDTDSWQLCEDVCAASPNCQYWVYDHQSTICLLLQHSDRSCHWNFGPRRGDCEGFFGIKY